MNTKVKTIVIIILIVVVVLGLGVFWIYQDRQPGKFDDFAKCISDKGAKFYGAFWCSHCQEQKLMFGKSAKYLPYVECSTPDSNGQLEVCQKEGIEVYPTWKFSDASKQEGEMTLDKLSEKLGCPLLKQ